MTATSRFEQRVARAVDDAHAAAPELPEDLVAVGELRADQSRSPSRRTCEVLIGYDSGHAGLREARRLLPRQGATTSRRRQRKDDLRPLRLARPRHARRLRRDDRQRQDRALPVAHRGGRDRRRAGDRDRPEGRPLQPAARRFPDLAPADFRPWIDEEDAGAQGPLAGRLREAAGRDVEEGPGRVGRGRRAHPAHEGRRGLRDLHARLDGGPAGLDPEVVRRARAGRAGGRGAPARAGRLDDDRPADAARRRRGPAQEPRAHPRLDGPRRAPGRRARTSTSRR